MSQKNELPPRFKRLSVVEWTTLVVWCVALCAVALAYFTPVETEPEFLPQRKQVEQKSGLTKNYGENKKSRQKVVKEDDFRTECCCHSSVELELSQMLIECVMNDMYEGRLLVGHHRSHGKSDVRPDVQKEPRRGRIHMECAKARHSQKTNLKHNEGSQNSRWQSFWARCKKWLWGELPWFKAASDNNVHHGRN